jgi:hypothetical protein
MQQHQQHQTGVNSYSSQNTKMNQNMYTSYGNNNQYTNIQQQNASLPSNRMLPGQGMHSNYGVNSQTSNNMSFQTNVDPNQMHATQNNSTSHGLQNPQYRQASSAQALFKGNQNQTRTPSTGMAPNGISAASSQIQNMSYQTTPATALYQQTRNNQSNVNNTVQQQINNIQTATPQGNIVKQPYQQPPITNLQQKNLNYGGSNQPPIDISNVPVVETVTGIDQQSSSTTQYATTATTTTPSSQQEQQSGQQNLSSNEGSGIDARSLSETPSVQAAKAAETVHGAPNSADGRRALLESALRCDLPKYLIESVLENQNLSKVKDPASVKVHAVELLKLLTQDPGYGLKFKLLLEEMPSWKKYASQDHSLFITGLEQKADYFLTDGSSSMEPKKLLTHK